MTRTAISIMLTRRLAYANATLFVCKCLRMAALSRNSLKQPLCGHEMLRELDVVDDEDELLDEEDEELDEDDDWWWWW